MSSDASEVTISRTLREPTQIHGDWQSLERHWSRVVSSEKTLGSRSGGWHVRKEYSGDGLAPAAGNPDEVAVYMERGTRKEEIGRWPLEDVAEYELGGNDE